MTSINETSRESRPPIDIERARILLELALRDSPSIEEGEASLEEAQNPGSEIMNLEFVI